MYNKNNELWPKTIFHYKRYTCNCITNYNNLFVSLKRKINDSLFQLYCHFSPDTIDINFRSAGVRYVASLVHCRHSSLFTPVEKPPLETSCLLFVEQHLNHTQRISVTVSLQSTFPHLHTLAAGNSAKWKDATGEPRCTFRSYMEKVLIVNYSLNPFSYGAIRNTHTRSSDSAGVHFLQ